MAAIDFPAGPTTGQIFSAAGKTWQWNGTVWDLVGSTPTAGPGGFVGQGIAPGVDQAGISTTVDVTGCSVTLPANASSRVFLVQATVMVAMSSGGPAIAHAYIADQNGAALTSQGAAVEVGPGITYDSIALTYILAYPATTTAVKLQVGFSTGTGLVVGTFTRNARITVTDIGSGAYISPAPRWPWSPLTLAANWSGSPLWRQEGDRIWLYGQITRNTSDFATSATLFTMGGTNPPNPPLSQRMNSLILEVAGTWNPIQLYLDRAAGICRSTAQGPVINASDQLTLDALSYSMVS